MRRLPLFIALFPLLVACTLGAPEGESVGVLDDAPGVEAPHIESPQIGGANTGAIAQVSPLQALQTRWESPFPDNVTRNIRAIYREGMARGNQPMVFSKVGDSITVNRGFLGAFAQGGYNLADYAHLQPIVDYFSQAQVSTAGNSFATPSLAARTGWAAWAVLDASMSDRAMCAPSETPLACEYRWVRPAFALVMFGTNDVGYRTTEQFRADLSQIVAYSIENGVIPILSTIPPRPDVAGRVALFNGVISDVADAYAVPLMDYHQAMLALPNYGLAADFTHPSTPPGGVGATADFGADNLRYGYVVRNLVALQALDAVVRTVLGQ